MNSDYVIVFSMARDSVTSGWNWEAIEALGTLFLGAVTLITLLVTISYSKKQIAFEKRKAEQEIKNINNRQRQQTIAIVKEFFDRKNYSLRESSSYLKDKIITMGPLLNDKNIKYLEKLKKQAITLETLRIKEKNLNEKTERETDNVFFGKNIIKLRKITQKIGEIETWFAERGDNVKDEI